jgi:hypothetical protein
MRFKQVHREILEIIEDTNLSEQETPDCDYFAEYKKSHKAMFKQFHQSHGGLSRFEG